MNNNTNDVTDIDGVKFLNNDPVKYIVEEEIILWGLTVIGHKLEE